jgi:hypothetical protein
MLAGSLRSLLCLWPVTQMRTEAVSETKLPYMANAVAERVCCGAHVIAVLNTCTESAAAQSHRRSIVGFRSDAAAVVWVRRQTRPRHFKLRHCRSVRHPSKKPKAGPWAADRPSIERERSQHVARGQISGLHTASHTPSEALRRRKGIMSSLSEPRSTDHTADATGVSPAKCAALRRP